MLTDDEGAFFLAIQLDTFLKPAAATNFAFDLILTPMGRDGGDADAGDGGLLPNNAPVRGEATFFFLVNQLRNPAPNPFLGDAGGVEADDAAEPVTNGPGADFLDDDDDGLLPNNAPVRGEATFFFLVNQLRNPAPNPFLGDAGGVEADDAAEPVTNGPGADFLDDDDELLPNNASELPDNEDVFFLAVRVNTFLTPAAAAGDGYGSMALFALASAIAFAAAFAFFASIHKTNLSLPFTSKSLVPLPIYLVPLVRAYKAGAPFLSFSSSAELERECLLLLDFLPPNFLAISSSSSFFEPILYLDIGDGSAPTDVQENGDDDSDPVGIRRLCLPLRLVFLPDGGEYK